MRVLSSLRTGYEPQSNVTREKRIAEGLIQHDIEDELRHEEIINFLDNIMDTPEDKEKFHVLPFLKYFTTFISFLNTPTIEYRSSLTVEKEIPLHSYCEN